MNIKLLSLNRYLLPAIGFTILSCALFVYKDTLQTFYRNHFQPIADSSISALYEKGAALHNAHQSEEAQKTFKEALASNHDISKILVHLGALALENNKPEEAIHYYHTALSLEPRHINAYFYLATAYSNIGNTKAALAQLEKAIALDPNYYEAYLQLARIHMDLKQWPLAISYSKKAIAIQPHNIHSYLNMGHVYNKKGDLELAASFYEKVIGMDNHCANAYYNLGYTLRLLKKPIEALTFLKKANSLKENYVDAHVCMAQCYWTLNDFENAWPEYEWRWKMLDIDPRKMNVPIWEGQDLRGKRILLYCEQGLGDTLQFIRFAKIIKDRGATVFCKVQKPLLPLLNSYHYVDHYVQDFADAKNLDYQIPLLNIPGVIKTNLHTIPAQIPYLKADPKLVDYWKAKLSKDKNFKIGLCWHVDPQHEVDKSPWALRSIPVTHFIPLAQIPGVSFYSLQKINGEEQLKDIPDSFNINTFGYNFDEKHGRFMDSAAVIMNLDLIICVDTSIAHLAAAMGKKVWMLLSYSPDPRWYDDRNDTPWYPTMRLFRQPKPYDWKSVEIELANALKKERAKI